MYAEQSPFLERENSCQRKVFVFMNYSSDMTRIAEMMREERKRRRQLGKPGELPVYRTMFFRQ